MARRGVRIALTATLATLTALYWLRTNAPSEHLARDQIKSSQAQTSVLAADTLPPSLEPVTSPSPVNPYSIAGQSQAARLFFEARKVRYGEPKKAIDLLLEASRLDPELESAREDLADLLLEGHEFSEAAAHASACLGISQSNRACHRILIQARVSELREGQSLSPILPLLEDCLRAAPGFPYCVEYLERYYAQTEDLAGAERMLREQLDADPQMWVNRQRLADFYTRNGEPAAARSVYKQGCEEGRIRRACIAAGMASSNDVTDY
jgi:predicted Zn-dependent protease